MARRGTANNGSAKAPNRDRERVDEALCGGRSGNPTGSVLATANTDANGYYRFDGLFAGTYVVWWT